MAEDSKQAFDPEATVAQPSPAAAPDPDATITRPIAALADADPEATVTGPLVKSEPDPEATDRRPAFDPEATDRRPAFDPEATVKAAPRPGRVRSNPFAPKAPPETIQANLSSLGGLNPLVAMANPILAAVPQIRRTLKHADPASLLATLRDQIEALEMSAISAEIPDDTVSAAVYALCALLDESAASTPWGGAWIENGLLQAIRGESGGAEGFFEQLERIEIDPEKHADLLEFLYVCLALGFEGRYRSGEGGRAGLAEVKERLYRVITRRRPRPDALSERWRTPAAQAAADAALETAARANAARAAADAAAKAPVPKAAAPSRFALSRLPRRAIWSAVAGIVGASIVLYMLALRLLEDETKAALSAKPSFRTSTAVGTTPGATGAPATLGAEGVAKALEGLPVAVSESGGRVAVALKHDHQFTSGNARPVAELRPVIEKIAAAIDKLPGAITVAGHADASPAGAHYATNQELSAARAQTVAKMMAAKLADPKRVAATGKADAEPIAPNDTDANRAKNRRVVILLTP